MADSSFGTIWCFTSDPLVRKEACDPIGGSYHALVACGPPIGPAHVAMNHYFAPSRSWVGDMMLKITSPVLSPTKLSPAGWSYTMSSTALGSADVCFDGVTSISGPLPTRRPIYNGPCGEVNSSISGVPEKVKSCEVCRQYYDPTVPGRPQR